MKQINKVRVVTRSFISDFIAKWLNFFGFRIKSYENMINNAIQDILKELEEENVNLKWYRYEISQFTNGAMAIMLYGEAE